MALPPLPELAVFMALVLVLSLYGLTVSGHFPEEHRARLAANGRRAGSAVGHDRALRRACRCLQPRLPGSALPLSAAVIGGGAMVLFAPLLLQPLPDSFVNGRRGLLIFAGLAAGLALMAGTLVA